jgi:hypothetical protein
MLPFKMDSKVAEGLYVVPSNSDVFKTVTLQPVERDEAGTKRAYGYNCFTGDLKHLHIDFNAMKPHSNKKAPG